VGDEQRVIAEPACRLVRLLPSSVIEAVADRLGRCLHDDWESLRGRVTQAVRGPHHRALVTAFLDRWRLEAPGVHPEAVALALLTACVNETGHREGQTVELVWTGPEAGSDPLRRTEQAILQVIESAERRILVVSYAVYNIPRIGQALVRAAGRGVTLTVVIEAPDPQAGKHSYDTLAALGPEVAARSGVYLWPHDRRPKDPGGRSGLLHVKCAAADERWLFLSSANLTEYAFTLNMELGLLVTGGDLPGRVHKHFDRLITDGILVSAPPGSS
jgi:phosphatidylserine/phosphatidylglycerophosphate/cardiolipin synthase-like enzyme